MMAVITRRAEADGYASHAEGRRVGKARAFGNGPRGPKKGSNLRLLIPYTRGAFSGPAAGESREPVCAGL